MTLTHDKLLSLLHGHASSFMAADPTLTPEAAVARSCALAVFVYDQLTMEAQLRTAAQTTGVPDTLARVIGEGSGATAALTLPS